MLTLHMIGIEHALGRRASIYAEYAGYGQTYSNASNDIAGLKRAAQVALDMGAVAPGDIDYIQANGMATKVGITSIRNSYKCNKIHDWPYARSSRGGLNSGVRLSHSARLYSADHQLHSSRS